MSEKCEYCKHCVRLYVPPIEAYKDIPSNTYVCTLFLSEGRVMYIDDNQGKCEMFQPSGRIVRIKGTKVLIGISMPTSCAECKFLCENEGRPFCLANKELITTDLADTEIYPLRKRSKRCPLVEMADPCSTCFVPLFYNLEDDDSICRDCEVGE